MAKTTKAATTKASKRGSLASLSQTHGALAPTIDMDAIFNIKSPYTAKSAQEYTAQLKEMGTADLQSHAHAIGIVPLDSRERLVAALERKFSEHKIQKIPVRQIPVQINPEMAEWHKSYQAGTLTS